jgi:hypothetical protein
MTDQTTNPYQLAQYIVPDPPSALRYNTVDANPILQQLETHLILFFMGVMLRGELNKRLGENEHPNKFIQMFAEEADDFCPGRTTSDLLLKLEIVNAVASRIGEAVKNSLLNHLRKGGPGAETAFNTIIDHLRKRQDGNS